MAINGIYRISCAIPRLHLGNPTANAQEIITICNAQDKKGAALVLFPELSLTGHTCGDLFFQNALHDAVKDALAMLLKASKKWKLAAVIGLPWKDEMGRILDCGAVLQSGAIIGMTPKSYLDAGQERHFIPGTDTPEAVTFEDSQFIVSTRQIYATGALRFCLEFGNELNAPNAPADTLAACGVNAVLNLSATPMRVDTLETRGRDVDARSSRLKCLYALANAGVGESSAAAVFGGGAEISFDGEQLASAPVLTTDSFCISADFIPRWSDTLKARLPWMRSSKESALAMEMLPLPEIKKADGLKLSAHPFALPDDERASGRALLVLNTLAAGLRRRAEQSHAQHLVIGLSGGLDSTFALLVCDTCREMMGKPDNFIIALTMPGMGTSSRTKNNAVTLATTLKCDLRTISIRNAVLQHFKDIGHPADSLNVVYENAQARERTQILMDLANENNGLLVGTGDLSEIALGWCTYNGDHISMYNVNADVPKTFMRDLVSTLAECKYTGIQKALLDVVGTPVSPELLPGKQHTEELIGDYDLHDFFLFHFIKYAESPENILELALVAFKGTYTPAKIKSSLQLFNRRFFAQQFKRNAATDGPAIGSVALDPHHGWQMPSDVDAAIFQALK